MSLESNLKNLRGQTAIVTGASSGLGHATALALSAAGVNLVITARRADRLEELRGTILGLGGQAEMLAGDAAVEDTAAQAVDLALKRFGRLDLLIHCAGQGRYKKLVETSIEEYDEMMNANMRSSFLFARAVVPHLVAQRSGTVILVSSIVGLAGQANESVYAATKFAQVGFAESLAEEVRGYGVKVCAFCPGGMKSEFAIGHGRSAEAISSSTMMNPEDVADVIVFTCMQPSNARIPQITVRHMGTQVA